MSYPLKLTAILASMLSAIFSRPRAIVAKPKRTPLSLSERIIDVIKIPRHELDLRRKECSDRIQNEFRIEDQILKFDNFYNSNILEDTNA